ncbi:MAG: ArsR family transcriptional regulator [Halodesulfurarchaeum sp.]
MTEDDTADTPDRDAEEGTGAQDHEEEITGEATGSEPESESKSEPESESTAGESGRGPRGRLEEGADRAVDELDTTVVDILSWLLDTETRGRIYVYLRQHPWSTSEEVAEGTGLYPSTVREALAELAEEEVLERRKRESEGAGNNPYEYSAIPPSDLVGSVVGRVQSELNTIFNMDRDSDGKREGASEPVTIEVEDGTGETEE